MEIELSLEFLRVVEKAAIESAKTMGLGDGHKADQAAVESMRKVMDEVPMDGTIVIGEGERDAAPMLFIGERIGAAQHVRGFNFPAVDIAVDPLEAPIFALRERLARLRFWPRAKKAACSTLPTCIWKRSSWGPRARAPWTWTLLWPKICAPLPSASTATLRTLW